jgi:predicted metal-dependent RNase
LVSDPAASAQAVDVIPIGGVGEFGMNMMLIACGETAVLVDAGVMFPEPELFGVDLVIPDLSVLDAYRGRIKALVLTHGHGITSALSHIVSTGSTGPCSPRASRSRWSSRSSKSTASTQPGALSQWRPVNACPSAP